MPHRFDPFGVYGDEPPEPEFTPMPPPPGIPSPDVIADFMKATGMIPVDAHVEVIAIGVEITHGDIDSETAAAMAAMAWRPGEPLPHTSRSFDDPPFMMSPEEWRERLIIAVREYDEEDEFAFALKAQLGNDMVKSHGVPVDTAMDGCEEFASWLWSEFRYASQPG